MAHNTSTSPGVDPARRTLEARIAAEHRLSDLLDAVDAAEAAVRSAEAARTQALIEAIRCTDADMVPVLGHDYAYRNLVAEIGVSSHAGERAASGLISTAVMARLLPATLDALEAGRVSYRHLMVIADQAATLPMEAVPAFEAAVLPHALAHTPAQTARKARALRERLHPETIAVRSARAVDERRFWVNPLADGMAEVGAILPAIQALAIDNRITRIATALRTTNGETRTLAQLQADAFCDLLLGDEVTGDRPAATRDIARRIRPEVRVTIPLMSLAHLADDPADLAGYGPIDLGTARDLTAAAPHLRRLFTDPFTGVPVATDQTKYRIDAALADWIRTRDRHCRFPGCQRQADATDTDHTLGRAQGGRSSPDNLALLCRNHHRLKDTAGWHLTQHDGGRLDWTSPAGRRHTTTPDSNDTDTGARLWEQQALHADDPQPADITACAAAARWEEQVLGAYP
ncbi:MAG: DUF222 domain-containing protein [Microbacteriaceae bacterium]